MLKLQIFFGIRPVFISLAFLSLHFSLFHEIVKAQDVFLKQVSIHGQIFKTYPFTYESKPGIPSPCLSDENREVILLKANDHKYFLLDVTQENGHPFNYQGIIRGKGNQLYVDTLDFPTLAYTGLHSLVELGQIQSITRIPIAEITYQGRPERMSGAGFMAEGEDIVSVIRGDNQLVSTMGLTHRDLSKPLFHLWNTVLYMIDYINRGIISSDGSDTLFYFGKKIRYTAPNCRGWQYSLFNDSIQGECQLELKVNLTDKERSFIDAHYSFLTDQDKKEFIEFLTHMHTGEMAAYYVQYYGFYEGHTDYRADPIKLAFMFGLKSIEDLLNAFEGDIYTRLKEHHLSVNE
jgi:hypothetical protein